MRFKIIVRVKNTGELIEHIINADDLNDAEKIADSRFNKPRSSWEEIRYINKSEAKSVY